MRFWCLAKWYGKHRGSSPHAPWSCRVDPCASAFDPPELRTPSPVWPITRAGPDHCCLAQDTPARGQAVNLLAPKIYWLVPLPSTPRPSHVGPSRLAHAIVTTQRFRYAESLHQLDIAVTEKRSSYRSSSLDVFRPGAADKCRRAVESIRVQRLISTPLSTL